MAYDLYPAVDENYDFPPEVRAALAKTMELRQVATQMTNIERNNLTGADLWDGRLILNSTIDRVQRYDAASATWQSLAEETDAIVGMTEASRDNLSGVGLFDGRVIYNTTSNRLNRYDSATPAWAPIIEGTDLQQVLATTGTPQPIGTASLGVSSKAAREDHVHALPGGLIASISEGLYVGNQAYPRTISLPFTPKLVVLYAESGTVYPEGLLKNAPFSWTTPGGASYNPSVAIATNGFTITGNGGTESIQRSVNLTGQTYKYVAFA